MKTKIKRIVFATLIILNCITIFYFSNQIANDSSEQSSRVVEFISNITPSIRNMEESSKNYFKKEILTPITRKCAHLSIYAVLGIFTINFMLTFEKIDDLKKILISLLFCTLYAITDEFHQTFILGRSGELRDILIDSLGALIGLLIMLLIIKIIKKIVKKEKIRKEAY